MASPHSTHLQNLTHQDIIRIGTHFESELRAELKSAADAEIEQKLADQAACHRVECERLEAEKNELRGEHEKDLIRVEHNFILRLEKEKKTWRKGLQGEINAEKENARKAERALAEEGAAQNEIENQKRATKMRNDFELEMDRKLEQEKRQSQAQFGQAKALLVSDLSNAKKEISKLKYAESERSEYVNELIQDIKETCREKFEAEKEEMEGVFEMEKLTLLQTQKQLKRELDETKDDLASAKSDIEQHKKKYIELKNQFQTFVMQNRPDLTEGQTEFMFEF